MSPRELSCSLCGSLTGCVVRQERPHNGDRLIPLCPECITLWQTQPAGRPLLLAARRCWGGGTIRHLVGRGSLEE